LNDSLPAPDEDFEQELEVQARYRLMEALAASERRARLRVEGLNEIVFETNSKFELSFVNRSWTAVLGKHVDVAEKSSFLEFVAVDDRSLARSAFGSEPGSCALTVIDADGKGIPMRLSVSRIDADSWVGSLFDLTERRIAQARAEAMNAELEARIEERSSALEREVEERRRVEVELHMAQKLEAVGQLAAGIAHEINTPLQYVGNNLDFLEYASRRLASLTAFYRDVIDRVGIGQTLRNELEQREKELDFSFINEELAPALKRTRQGTTRVQEIVRSIQDFSHPDGSVPREVSLGAVVQVALALVCGASRTRCRVESNLEPGLRVRGYEGALKQVAVNLLLNAIQAACAGNPDDGGTVWIRTESDHEFVRLVVEDDGPGIDPSYADRIYDPFFTTKGVGEGTGQGLAIARRIVVDRHGGQITAETRPGGGARFVVAIPRVSDSQSADAKRGIPS
jgi:signal transduction histidine kinase